jgi:hypothetical protein
VFTPYGMLLCRTVPGLVPTLLAVLIVWCGLLLACSSDQSPAIFSHASRRAKAEARHSLFANTGLLRLSGGQDEEEAKVAARAQAAREQAMARARADGLKFAPSVPSFPSGRSDHREKRDGRAPQRRRQHVSAHSSQRVVDKKTGPAGVRVKNGERRVRKDGAIVDSRWRARDAGVGTRERGGETISTTVRAGREDKEGREAGASGKGGAGYSKDFRDADRERQRLAREERGRGERRRGGEGIAVASELLSYVQGEALVAHSLALPEIAGELDGLEFVRRVDVSNNSLQSLGGLRRLGKVRYRSMGVR